MVLEVENHQCTKKERMNPLSLAEANLVTSLIVQDAFTLIG
jgi:hypothetical protein